MLIEESVRILNKYMELEKRPVEYASGMILYPSEIHTIEAIGKHPESNVSQLADILGIKKGSVSKFLNKLEKKELIERYKKEGNQKNVLIRLTDSGQEAFRGHEEYHRGFYKKMNAMFEEASESDIRVIKRFLTLSEKMLDDFLK